jgi:N-acetylneuraminate synthase
MREDIFKNLFVLELANNHWGSLKRGKEIVRQFAKVVKKHNVKAAIKLQFRDLETFIHKDHTSLGAGAQLTDLPKKSRYIQKISRTSLSKKEYKQLVSYIKKLGCIPMATPFDEKSVDLCVEFGLGILKIASSDINDWTLLNKMASTGLPVIASTGGANDKQIDDFVKFFTNRDIPIAINHCVSKYPSEDDELELNQIDYLKDKYPDIVIGLSTHEYHDWYTSMHISYAKGARTWERHIDIPYPAGHEQKEITKYCSTPEQVDTWFAAFRKARIMCGSTVRERRVIDDKEANYLFALHRGLYLKRDIKKGDLVTLNDLYSAVPYQRELGHMTSRDFIDKEYVCRRDLKKDQPLTRENIS